MFACTSGATNKEIHIYNYYTNECPKSMQYIGHTNKVKSIAWFENDMGFASTGLDGNIYFYDLYGSVKDMQKRNDEFDYPINNKDAKMQCLSTIPGSATKYDVLAVGTDR
jgi:WD40 repeat protein